MTVDEALIDADYAQGVGAARRGNPVSLQVLAAEVRRLRREIATLSHPRIVELTPDNCRHNRSVDPDTGFCDDCESYT